MAPLERRRVVFRSGTPKGSIVFNRAGVQDDPISMFGLKEEWKKAQKKEKNRLVSLTIKSNMPKRNPFSTLLVCFPR